jgi:hypothetical protein
VLGEPGEFAFGEKVSLNMLKAVSDPTHNTRWGEWI